MNDLIVHQNTTFRALAKLVDADKKPLDPSAWTVWSQVRPGVDESLIVEFSVKPVADGFMLSLTPKQTSKLTPGVYQYDVLGKTSDEEVFLLAEGMVEVVSTITELKP